ncbi:DoxX family protein [Flavobacterium sharifuzzamanii]|uniref:DoxX family protein n=1 Tax=Flavobacterium sharifuzzamanii TaxID=2211133 RepID=UPI000DAB3CDC|nr:hypothetical protein [Flavobacterium sharifuzzamanii]KAF2079190.1 hypothetical protein DMA14_22175 [Flavobacterium sharifuzzamanii]
METLIILFGVFIATLLIIWLTAKRLELAFAGRVAISVMLVFTAIGHFVFAKGMAMMISFLPFANAIVFITGIIELIAAIGLLLPKTKILTGKLLILFFILLLPANIYAASHNINLQNADYTGKGLSYLWIRIPMQLLFIAWVYFSSLGINQKSK